MGKAPEHHEASDYEVLMRVLERARTLVRENGLHVLLAVLVLAAAVVLYRTHHVRRQSRAHAAWDLLGGLDDPSYAYMESPLEAEQALALALAQVRQALANQTGTLESIARNTQLSDAAKSVVYREQEVETLRTVIRTGILQQQWEPTISLIDEMERRFGYEEAAKSMRAELEEARQIVRSGIEDANRIGCKMMRVFGGHDFSDWTALSMSPSRAVRLAVSVTT